MLLAHFVGEAAHARQTERSVGMIGMTAPE
jgi:hypothetical protein